MKIKPIEIILNEKYKENRGKIDSIKWWQMVEKI